MKQPLAESRHCVTVGIPAFNEEQNVARLIKSVLSQDQLGYAIEKILVISDGSSDGTVEAVKSMNSSRVEVIDHKQRKGKITRLKEIFKISNTELLVLMDADVVLTDISTFSKLLAPFMSEPDVWLVSGRPVKLASSSFTESVMDVSAYLQDFVKKQLNNGNNLYACHGRLVAMRGHLSLNLASEIQKTSIDDAFYYLYNKTHGHEFRYVDEARCSFRMPQEFSDFKKQRVRFVHTKREMEKLFGSVASDEFSIPFKVRLKALLNLAFEKPVWLLLYVVFRLISLGQSSVPSTWELAKSTKKL